LRLRRLPGTRILPFAIALVALSSCGVKGPPLPPVADDPAASEREDKERARLAAPSPTPSPSPSPSAAAKKRKR
jgi:predicted small lipoprotein YifL